MIFLELNTSKIINLIHISNIKVDDKCVVYEPAKGSITDIREYFDTAELAQARYDKLKKSLLVK